MEPQTPERMSLEDFAKAQQFMVRRLAQQFRQMMRIRPDFDPVAKFHEKKAMLPILRGISENEFMTEFWEPGSFSNF